MDLIKLSFVKILQQNSLSEEYLPAQLKAELHQHIIQNGNHKLDMQQPNNLAQQEFGNNVNLKMNHDAIFPEMQEQVFLSLL
jgi:hypothetical protein